MTDGEQPARAPQPGRPAAQGSADGSHAGRTRLRAGLVVAVLLLVVLLGLGLAAGGRLLDLAVSTADRPAGSSTETVVFVVQPGETASQIGQQLQDRGLIESSRVFWLLARYYGLGQHLQAGEYELSPSMTVTEILSRLNQGLVRATRVTIPEGWRIEEMAQDLQTDGVFPAAAFRRAAQGSYDYAFLPPATVPNRLEGYLFPDTYAVRPGMQPAELVRMMLDDFQRRVVPLAAGRSWPGGLTLHQAITLASIVEREAVLPQERPIIASVYLNRLRLGMPLDADPTLQYAVAPPPVDGKTVRFWPKELTDADKASPSPYNTYRIAGLPPGPICNPGLASIQAVLEPASTSYLYFVARGDGSHAFATTLQEHLANVARYR